MAEKIVATGRSTNGQEFVEYEDGTRKNVLPSDVQRDADRYWAKEDEKNSPDNSNLTVTVTADVNDAITGFKALSRELRETTKAARELESAYKGVEKASVLRLGTDGEVRVTKSAYEPIHTDEVLENIESIGVSEAVAAGVINSFTSVELNIINRFIRRIS